MSQSRIGIILRKDGDMATLSEQDHSSACSLLDFASVQVFINFVLFVKNGLGK